MRAENSLFLLILLIWLGGNRTAGRRAWLGNSQRAWWRADSGSGPDTLQTPEDPFPPVQSCGVWEVHRAIVIAPFPEQRVECGVVQRHYRGQPSELPGLLHESMNGRSLRTWAEKRAATSIASESKQKKKRRRNIRKYTVFNFPIRGNTGQAGTYVAYRRLVCTTEHTDKYQHDFFIINYISNIKITGKCNWKFYLI